MDLKKFRHDYKLSQSDLATIFGCKQSNVSSLENSCKPLSKLFTKILIDKYGYEAISKYADKTEMPATPSVNIEKNENKGSGNMQTGEGIQINTDAALVEVMKMQADQNTALLAELSKRSEQMDRLITLLEKK